MEEICLALTSFSTMLLETGVNLVRVDLHEVDSPCAARYSELDRLYRRAFPTCTTFEDFQSLYRTLQAGRYWWCDANGWWSEARDTNHRTWTDATERHLVEALVRAVRGAGGRELAEEGAHDADMHAIDF